MNTFTKTLQLTDYPRFRAEMEDLLLAYRQFAPRAELVVEHRHRLWEYGMAMNALGEKKKGLEVLDVGAGVGLLGPTLACLYEVRVTEVDPDLNWAVYRSCLNLELKRQGKRGIRMIHGDTGSLPEEEFDAVFCISVLEHMEPQGEERAWEQLASRVRPGGVLFLTMECMETDSGPHRYDECRKNTYTMEKVKQRVERLLRDFEPMGEPDYEYHGSFVYDYTFASVGLRRKRMGMVTDPELGM
jgi:SAM-dependent methyltransferase